MAKNPISALKFQNSKDEIHQQVWRKVDLEKSQEIVNLFDGAQIVQSNPNYGFVVESSQAEGLKRKFCNLQTTGNLGQRFYALAFPKGSEWTDKVSKQILRYVENGDIYRLKNKWNNLPQNCVQTTENESTLVRTLPYRKLRIVIFGAQFTNFFFTFFSDGPFMLLLISGIAALFLAFAELFFYSILRSKRITYCLPPNGPTGSRGGKTCAILKDELNSVISFKPHQKASSTEAAAGVRKRNGKLEAAGVLPLNGGTHLSPRINHRRANGNGDILKNGYKNGGQFYQAQALLRKDVSLDQHEDNAQL